MRADADNPRPWLAFLIGGHMSVSVSGRGGLLLRVASEGVTTKRQLERWVQRGVAYARPRPLKKK